MLSLIRNLRNARRNRVVAQMSILCRGKPISREELYTYTNGRFLVDEDHQLARRYWKFNLDALCDIAAAADGSTSRIAAIEKLEGGFSKALLMTKEDGGELVAKIPCRIAGPAFLTTASEVGVLEYIRKCTSIPAPRVFAWSSDSSNPVRAEYIIMEKATGVPLFERWGKMAEIEKLELIKSLTQLEAQLSAISFPAYGGLYLQADAGRFKHTDLDENVVESRLFCIGPSPEASFGDVDVADQSPTKRDSINYGPWHTLSDLGISIAKRELSRIERQPKDGSITHRGSTEEQTRILKATIRLMSFLDSHPVLAKYFQPTLWHTDLHMGNIFVSPNDNSHITALIDVQSLSVLPLFFQARWPVFLQPPREYTRGFIQPSLPDNFDALDEEEKAIARHEWMQAKMAKAYEVSSFLENRKAHDAMTTVPRVFRELFIRTGEVSDVGVVPLRECLIEIFQNWSDLGMTGLCPYSFSEEEISAHEKEFARYREWNEVQQLAQEALDTDAEGWVAPQVDFAKKQSQNKELLAMFIQRMAEEKSEEEARQMWPFLE